MQKPHILVPVGIALLAFLVSGCNKQENSDRKRIAMSLSNCRANLLSEDGGIKSKIREKVIKALERATPDSIKSPELCAVVIWGESDDPLVQFWWIQDHPTADGLLLRWPGNSSGLYLKVPDELLNGFMNDKTQLELVCYPLGIPLETYTRNGLSLPSSGIEAALANNGHAISPFLECDLLLPTSRATQ